MATLHFAWLSMETGVLSRGAYAGNVDAGGAPCGYGYAQTYGGDIFSYIGMWRSHMLCPIVFGLSFVPILALASCGNAR